jgi:hypothetical protein
MKDNIDRYMSLFKGLQRAYGSWQVLSNNGGRASTIKSEVSREHYSQHLLGDSGLGIVPINEDNQCVFGAIDIDDHKKEKKDIHHGDLAKKVTLMGLPLVVCKSKSGGAHCYHFCEDPIPASQMRSKLLKWASELGYRNVEIFPKQVTLGENEVGNWINLPYYGTSRVAFGNDGKMMYIEDFLDHAEDMKAWSSENLPDPEKNLDEAPPCLEFLAKAGVREGERNNALFNFAVYFKKSDPENWEENLYKLNYTRFEPPLPQKEMLNIVKSNKRNEYRYKCKDEPICSLCDAGTCKQRKFGIDVDDPLDQSEVLFGGLTKIEYSDNSALWILEVSGKKVRLTSTELMSFKRVREKCLDAITILLPKMKGEEWEQVYKRMLKTVHVEIAPEDAQQYGPVIDALAEYVRLGRDILEREMLLTGPVRFQENDNRWYIGFQIKNFEQFLKNKKMSKVCSRNELYMLLKSKNYSSKKVRVNLEASVNCWLAPVSAPKNIAKKRKVVI